MTPKSLTPADLATRWQVSRRTVYAILNAGECPSFKVRGQLRVRESDADKYEEANANPLSRNPYNGAA